MYRVILVVCLMTFIATSQVLAQSAVVDVVYLKNGTIIRGTIIEEIPGKSLKIQTQDKSVFVCEMEEITKITKEPGARSGGGVEIKKDASAAGIEIGTLFGLSYVPSLRTRIGVPTSSTDNLPSLYFRGFPSKQFAIGPEVKFYRRSLNDDYDSGRFSDTRLRVGFQGAFFSKSHLMSNPYILGYGFLSLSDTSHHDMEVHCAIGAGLGYQWRIGSAFIFRTEGRYHRWINVEEQQALYVHDFLFILGIGTRLNDK